MDQHTNSSNNTVFADADGRTHLFYQGNSDHGKTWYLSRVELDWSTGSPVVKR